MRINNYEGTITLVIRDDSDTIKNDKFDFMWSHVCYNWQDNFVTKNKYEFKERKLFLCFALDKFS